MKQYEFKKTGINNEGLFSGFFIRWNKLTQSEKVITTAIIFIPLWWFWGWRLLFVFLFLGILVYEYCCHRNISFKAPNVTVLGIVGFGAYTTISEYLYAQTNGLSLNPNAIISPINEWIFAGLIFWYIQSKDIRIRLPVVAWSCSIVIIMMLFLWVIIYFGLNQADYIPHRSIYGLLTSKGERYIPGVGNSNYLIPYFATDASLPGMVRYVYFFHGPESLALFVAFVCLLALDIKNRLWSLLLFLASFFLLLTSGTRAVWVALPAVLCLRYLLKFGKASGIWFLCTFIAVASYFSLALPPVTNLILDSVANTAEATGKLRADSTEIRNTIYSRTFEAIVENSDTNLLFGHVVPGKGVLPGYKPAKIGTHSFLLSSLIYRSGLFGTGIFLIYWGSLFWWLYDTQYFRPMCILIFAIFSITFATMEMEMTVMPISLICVTLEQK
jgi:hypothetical protein